MKSSAHAKQIEAAAREHLRSLGLKQRGRSRLWEDDRGWFLIGVEFQPSSFAKGSYLNVGCCWLWHAKPHFSFDLGYREEGFHAVTPGTDYHPTANALASHAGELVQRYRSQFSSVADLAMHYGLHPPATFWDRYHAAMATGLTHQVEQSKALFDEAANEATSTSPQWLREAADRCRTLAGLVNEVATFRMEVQGEIYRARKMFELPATTEPFGGAA